MAEKSKRELKKEEKIKEENIRKLDEQIRENKKIPKEYKKKINKQIILNTITLIIIAIYLSCINILSLYIDTEIYLKYLKVFSIILAIISVVYFEISYRKDNEKLFLYGVEILFLAIITLFSNYAYYIFFNTYNKILLGITIVFVVYYIVKIFMLKIRMKKKYYKEQNDIKDITKKN